MGVQSLLLPFINPAKNNLHEEQPYTNKLAAQLQSAEALQKKYIFKQTAGAVKTF